MDILLLGLSHSNPFLAMIIGILLFFIFLSPLIIVILLFMISSKLASIKWYLKKTHEHNEFIMKAKKVMVKQNEEIIEGLKK